MALLLPIEIDQNAVEQSALKIIEILRPSWRKADVRFKKFGDGLMNILIGCFLNGKYEDEVVLIRMNGKNTDIIVDRENEEEMMHILNEAGFCPTIYAILKNGMVYEFVHGEILDRDKFRDDKIAKLIAYQMAKLHSIQPAMKNQRSGLFETLDRWFKNVPESFEEPEMQKRYVKTIKPKLELVEETERLKQELETMDCPIVVAHNDLHIHNIVYNEKEGKISFIDYEFTMYNYRAFDIGTIFRGYAGINDIDDSKYPDKPYQLKWIKNYLTYCKELNHDPIPVTDEEVEKLYVQTNKCALVSYFVSGTWALVQTKYGLDRIDYLEFARVRFDEYFRKKDELLSIQ